MPPHVTRAFVNYPTASVLKMDLKFPEIFALRMIDVTEFLRWSLSPLMMPSTITT